MDITAWVILALVCYFVAGLIAWAIYKDFELSKKALAVISAIFVVAINAASLGLSSVASDSPSQYANDVTATAFGLESGRSYELRLGSRLSGGDFKGLHFVDSDSGSSMLSVSFTTPGNDSYILELPTEDIRFQERAEAINPTVVIYLNGTSTYGDKEEVDDGSCGWIIQSGFLACDRQITYRTVVGQWYVDHGLPQIVNDNFDRAVITLTPDLYNRILGARESG